MAYSSVTYTYSASKTFNVAFTGETGSAATNSKPYINIVHIKTRINGAANTDFTTDISGTPSTLTFGAGTTMTAGDKVEIYRETPRTITDRTVDFVSAAMLTESDLDLAAIHEQFLAQEALDTLDKTIQVNVNPLLDVWDAQGKVVTNAGTATDASHLVTKDYVDTQVLFQGAASAQAWELSPDGATSKFRLSSPDPSGVQNELYITEVDGIMQSPSSEDGVTVRDYKVYQDLSDSKYYIEFETGSFPKGTGTKCPPNLSKLSVQNMGISKSSLTGSILFESGSATDTPVSIKGYGGQTADLLVVKNSSDANLFEVAADGSITAAASATLSMGGLTLQGDDGADVPAVIKQHASQTGHLLNFTNSSGTSLDTVVTKDGELGVGITSGDKKVNILTSSTRGGVRIKAGSGATGKALLRINDNSDVNIFSVVYADGVWQIQPLDGAVQIYKKTDGDVKFEIMGDSAQEVSPFDVYSQSSDAAPSFRVTESNRAQATGAELGRLTGMQADSDGTALTINGHTTQNSAVVKINSGSDNPVLLMYANMDSVSVGSRLEIRGMPSQTEPALRVANSSNVEAYTVSPSGTVARNGIRRYAIAQCGAWYADNTTRAALGGVVIGGVHTYTKVSDTVTRVNLATTMPDTDYEVIGIDMAQDPYGANFVGAASSKTTTTFNFSHRDEDVSFHPQISWQLLY